MSLVAPNLSMIVGSTVAAKLIGMSLSLYMLLKAMVALHKILT